MRRELRGEVEVHEAEVVVAVRGLRRAAGVDHVRVGDDLVVRAEPGDRDEVDDVVGEVVDERLGVGDGQLLQRAPQPVVAAGLGEVVAGLHAAGLLLLDQRRDHRRGPVDDRGVERVREDDDAGARPSARAPARPAPRGGPRRWRRRPRASRRRTARRARRGPRAGSRRRRSRPRRPRGSPAGCSRRGSASPTNGWAGRGLRSRRTPSSARDGHVQVHRRDAIGQPLPIPQKPLTMVGVGHPFRIREIADPGRVVGGDRRPRAQRPRRGTGQHRRRGPPGHRGPAPAAHAAPPGRPDVRRGPRRRRPDTVLERRARRAGGRAARASGPAVIRSRFHLTEAAPAGEIVDTLDRIATRGSQGVVLKAPDDPRVIAAVDGWSAPASRWSPS